MVRMTSEQARRFLQNVSEEHIFYCSDSRVARSLEDLRDALASMADETFAYHCNPEKSDFSNWVADTIKDEKLSRDLRKSVNRAQAARSVQNRIAFLNSKLV